MGAFSYIIADLLYLSCGLAMGSDFSPAAAAWEVCRRLAEQLATSLFSDNSLRDKHRKYLDQLQWAEDLGKGNPDEFVLAPLCTRYNDVLDAEGTPVNTPHHLFVDDDVTADVYDVARNEQSSATGTEALFILLGESDLAIRQDPIAWDKLFEMIIDYQKKVLGFIIDTRKMTIETPADFLEKVNKLLTSTWHRGRASPSL